MPVKVEGKDLPKEKTAKRRAHALEHRKAWTRAAALELMGAYAGPAMDSEDRRSRAYDTVDQACAIWDMVEGRLMVPVEDTDG